MMSSSKIVLQREVGIECAKDKCKYQCRVIILTIVKTVIEKSIYKIFVAQ